MKKNIPKNVILLGFVSLLNDIASDMIYPLLPLFITSAGGSAKTLGMIEGVSETVSSILKLVSGKISDSIRKRKLLAFLGYFLSNALRPLYYFVNHWETIFIIRFLDRVGKGIRTAPRDALIAESVITKDWGRAFGFHRSLDNLGAFIGPMISSLLLAYFTKDIKNIFLLSLIPGMIVIFLFIFVREKQSEQDLKTQKQVDIGNDNGFDSLPINVKLFILSVLIFTIGNSSDAFLILRLKEAGIDTVYIPFIWGIFNLIKSAGNYPSGLISDRIGRRKVIFIGWLLYACVYFLLGTVKDKYIVLFLFLLYGGYYSITEGAERAYIADNVTINMRGRAYGYYNFAISITSLPASLLFGYLWDKFSYKVAFYSGAFFSAVAIFILLFSSERARDIFGFLKRRI